MTTTYCHQSETTPETGGGRIRSVHNTADGPIAYVECPDGHFEVVRYGPQLVA